MVLGFVIEKLEAHWNHIEIELGPTKWARFTRQYRAAAALDAQDTEIFIRQLRELMTSAPCTERLWQQWREEADFTSKSADAEAWSRTERDRKQRLEQLVNRYRDMGASNASTPPVHAALNPVPNTSSPAPAERN